MKAIGKWSGTVSLIGDRNILTDSADQVPLTGLTFQGEDNELIVYLISSCPGLFNGDEQEISCHVEERAHLFLTDTSATELHPSANDDESVQTQKFKLANKSILEYMPEVYIPFKGSNFRSNTSVYMSEGAQAVIGDIIAAGRVGRNEIHEYIGLKTSLEVFWEGKLIAWDTLQLHPKTNLKSLGILGNYTHIGTLWILSEDVHLENLSHIQDNILTKAEDFDYYAGATMLKSYGIVVRLLGHSAEDLQLKMKEIWDYIRKKIFHLRPLEVLK